MSSGTESDSSGSSPSGNDSKPSAYPSNSNHRRARNGATWSTERENLLCRWGESAKYYNVMHTRACKYYQTLDHRVGAPSMVISGVSASAFFGTISADPVSCTFKVILAVFMGTGVALQAAHHYYKFARLAEGHRNAAALYNALFYEIQDQLAYSRNDRDDAKEYSNNIKSHLIALREKSPQIPQHIMDRYLSDLDSALPQTRIRVNTHTDQPPVVTRTKDASSSSPSPRAEQPNRNAHFNDVCFATDSPERTPSSGEEQQPQQQSQQAPTIAPTIVITESKTEQSDNKKPAESYPQNRQQPKIAISDGQDGRDGPQKETIIQDNGDDNLMDIDDEFVNRLHAEVSKRRDALQIVSDERGHPPIATSLSISTPKIHLNVG